VTLALHRRLRTEIDRLEREWNVWREEPLKRVALRNSMIKPIRRHQFHQYGEQSIIDRPAWLYGTHRASVGAGVLIMHGSWIAVERIAWEKPEPVLVIGNRVWIRSRLTISAVESIVIEDDVLIAGGVTIVDANHTWAPGDPNPMHGPMDSRPVRVGRGTWLGERVVVARGADIGEQCAVGAGAVVTSHIPDFSIVVGVPARVVGSTRS
jgi:acetyltransferase-like isoleucine patch superfamily enzyme